MLLLKNNNGPFPRWGVSVENGGCGLADRGGGLILCWSGNSGQTPHLCEDTGGSLHVLFLYLEMLDTRVFLRSDRAVSLSSTFLDTELCKCAGNRCWTPPRLQLITDRICVFQLWYLKALNHFVEVVV